MKKILGIPFIMFAVLSLFAVLTFAGSSATDVRAGKTDIPTIARLGLVPGQAEIAKAMEVETFPIRAVIAEMNQGTMSNCTTVGKATAGPRLGGEAFAAWKSVAGHTYSEAMAKDVEATLAA